VTGPEAGDAVRPGVGGAGAPGTGDTASPGAGDAASPGAPLMELAGVVKHYQAGGLWSRGAAPVQAVAGVDLAIPAGATVGVVGESGCGKSTLGRLIVGLEAPTAGQIRLRGQNRAGMSRADRLRTRGDVQLMFQDPYASLNPRMTVQRIMAEPLTARGGMSHAERRQRIHELAEEVGLARDHLGRYPHELSGGQRQRVGLARALAPSPSLIVADEPVSALDVSVRSQILNLMVSLQAQHDLAYLMISHDLSVVRYVSGHIAVMYLGKIVESGTPEELFGQPAHHYTRALIDSIPQPDPARPPARGAVRGELPSAADPPSGCRFRTRCPAAQSLCAEKEPPLRPFGGRHLAACHFPLIEPAVDAARPGTARTGDQESKASDGAGQPAASEGRQK
jgi:oligopeptide/dipeptide ABC transporter ATP-binding protein